MFHCSLCTYSCTKIDLLINHLSYIHKYSVNRFVCKQNSCYREFNKLGKFKAHLLNKHVIDQNISVSPQNKFTFTIQNADLNIENVCTQDVSNNNDYHDKKNYNDNNIIVNSNIKDRLMESASSFISTFYNDKNIHNNHIQKIIIATKEFIENDIILSLENNIHEALKKSNIDNNEIKLHIGEIFHAYKNPFHGLESEYKRLQFFKKKGSFIEVEQSM